MQYVYVMLDFDKATEQDLINLQEFVTRDKDVIDCFFEKGENEWIITVDWLENSNKTKEFYKGLVYGILSVVQN